MRWRTGLTPGERLVDAGIALLVALLSLQPAFEARGCGCDPFPWWGYALVTAQALPLVWRRRFPFAASAISGACTFAYGVSTLEDGPVAYAGLVGLYSAAAYASRRLSIAAAGIATTAIAIALLVDDQSDLQDAVTNYLLFAAAWLLGDSARTRRERARDAEERATQLERTRVAEAEKAVVQERNRIARELHDVVAHAVSLMVVQAEAGPVVVAQDPEKAVQLFDSISATGKQALTEMRRLLGVLRTADSGPAELMPQPGLDRLPELVAGARAAGVEVALVVAGDVRPLPPAVELSAFRVVQEAVTNVVRHSGARTARATVTFDVDALCVEVQDDGRGRAGTALPPGGNGLLAMRERVGLVGGELTAGARPEGGWRVSTRMPL